MSGAGVPRAATNPGAGNLGPGTPGAGIPRAGHPGGASNLAAGSPGTANPGTGSQGAGAPDNASAQAGAGGDAAGSGLSEPWAAIVGRLELGGAARQLASNCLLIGRQGAVVRLALDARNKHMRTPAQEDKLTQALSRYFGHPVRLEFEVAAMGAETPAQVEQRASMEELDAARRAFESDPGVQGLRERFGATLLPDTVRPVK